MIKRYEERMKEHGYMGEMFATEKLMFEAARKHLRVKLVCTDGTVYVGSACGYTKADDEETGFSSICINTEDGGFGFLSIRLSHSK